MAAPSTQALLEHGWQPAGWRLWTHESLGEARFESREAWEIASRSEEAQRPRRAPACVCAAPIVETGNELGRRCLKCARALQ